MNKQSHNQIDYELLGRYLAGEASPAEAIRLEEWLSASNDNKRLFEQISNTWSRLSSEEYCILPGKEEFFRQISSRIDLQSAKKHSAKKIKLWISVAASFLIIVSAALLLTIHSEKKQPHNVMAVVRSSAEQILYDTLPDKSVAILNSHSTIKYPNRFIAHERDVQLSGEAWFNVTANKQQPFIITTGPIKVKVVGTSFNVRNAGHSIEVAVKTGIVQMISPVDRISLHPGEKGIYDTITKQLSLTNTFTRNEIAYATKVFNFENATLKEIADQLEKAYGITIVIKNEKLLQCTMSSTFDNKPIEYIFDVLAMTLNIRYQIVNKTVYISGNSCT